jgi:hypothetical protein
MRRCLNAWENQKEEDNSFSEQKPVEENETNEYVDEEGFVHMTIPSDDDY